MIDGSLVEVISLAIGTFGAGAAVYVKLAAKDASHGARINGLERELKELRCENREDHKEMFGQLKEIIKMGK